jgi:hypothetical protein
MRAVVHDVEPEVNELQLIGERQATFENVNVIESERLNFVP